MDENTNTALDLLDEIERLKEIEEKYYKLCKHHATVEAAYLEVNALAVKLTQQINSFDSEQFHQEAEKARAEQLKLK